MAVALLALAACTSEDSSSERVAEEPLALLDVEMSGTSTPTDPDVSPRAEPEDIVMYVDSSGLDLQALADAETAAAPETGSDTVTNSGSPNSPSSHGGSASPTPPNGVPPEYTGLLGTLGIDDILFGRPAPNPTVVVGTAPLTGLPGSIPNRRAVIVKIDNSSKALPQTGLNQADIVFEEEVEWGITRLAAVFHTKMTTVGPVRSGRTTDISFINSFGGPALAYSGANWLIDALLLRQTTIRNYSAARSSGYWREDGRPAPSNLYTDTGSFGFDGSSPPAQFSYGPSTGGAPTSSVSVRYPSTSVKWSWSGSAWKRTQNGSAHRSDGAQIAVANVVVAVVPEVATNMRDSAGGSVPEYVFAGSGPVSVFVNGTRIDGTWTRPTLRDPAILTDSRGNVIQLTPGRTWVQLVVAGSYSSS